MDNYVIHRADSHYELERKVNEALKKGHVALGGATAYIEEGGSGFSQYSKLYFMQATAKRET